MADNIQQNSRLLALPTHRFVPMSERTVPSVTKEYLSPGELFRSIREKSGQSQTASTKEILTSNGIEFPPGASATLLASSKLVDRNTAENLVAFEALLDRKTVEFTH